MNQNFLKLNPCYEPDSFSFDQYQPLQSFVTQQIPQRSNEDIRLEMAKLIKNNQFLLNNNTFPREEASMELLNDSRTIDEMLKQREQAVKLVVQQEQEEQATQSFIPYWKFSMIDDKEVLQSRENFMKAIQTFLQKFSRYSFGVMPKNHPTFYNDDEGNYIQYKEYLENSSDAITTILPTKEPEYSLSMGYVHLSTIQETESDEVIKSSVKNLVQIPSEYEVTSDDESECDVPVKDESSLVFTTFSNPLFDCNDDFTSSDDESLSNEDVPMENFKVYSNSLFDDEEINSDKVDPHYFNAESDLIKSLSNHDTLIDSSSKFYYLEEISGELMPSSIVNEEQLNAEIAYTSVEFLSPSPIPVKDSDSLIDEIDLFLATDDLMPPGIESDDYDSERDIHFLEELLSNDSIPLPKNESSNFDDHDDLSFPRPPPKPSNVEFFFDLEPNSGELISAVINNMNKLNEDECFDPGGEIDVFANIKDDNYFPFIFVIRIFLSYLIYPEVSPLLLSTRSEDTIFDPGIST
nr:hypothetical protein [Tanacetum cinerariifolium]